MQLLSYYHTCHLCNYSTLQNKPCYMYTAFPPSLSCKKATTLFVENVYMLNTMPVHTIHTIIITLSHTGQLCRCCCSRKLLNIKIFSTWLKIVFWTKKPIWMKRVCAKMSKELPAKNQKVTVMMWGWCGKKRSRHRFETGVIWSSAWSKHGYQYNNASQTRSLISGANPSLF